MAKIEIINDDKLTDNKKGGDILNTNEDNNYKQKLYNQNNLDTLEDNDLKSKTIFTEKDSKKGSYLAANTTTKKNNNFTSKTNTILQEKLKKIFMVREKGKYEYNKQEIPENLKYHSDDSDSSEISELRKSKKFKNSINRINTNINNDNQIGSKISVKRQNSGFSKKDVSFNNKKNERERSKNEINSEEENNSPNIPKNNNIISNDTSSIATEDTKGKNYNNFNKKILDNYISEMNKDENDKKNDEKNEQKNDVEEKKQEDKNFSIKDIIEKLKAKKIEKEELGKKEKEAEEESIMRRKVKYKEKKEKEEEGDTSINESKYLKEKNLKDASERIKERKNIREKFKKNDEFKKKEEEKKRKEDEKIKREEEKRRKEEEKKRKEEEKMKKEEEKKRKEEEKLRREEEEEEERRKEEEERRKEEERIEREKEENMKKEKYKKLKNSRSKEKNKHYKRSLDIKNDNRLLPHKIFKNEKDEEEEMKFFIKKSNEVSQNNNKNKNKSKDKDIRRKQLEADINEEINKEELSDNEIIIERNQLNQRQRLNSNDIYPHQRTKNKYIIEKNNELNNNTYKKPINKITNNRICNVYRPKRPGAIRGRSQEKGGSPCLLLNKINNNSNAIKNSSNNIFSTINTNNYNYNINTNKSYNSNNGRITYSKKRSPIKEKKNFLQLNNSFCGYNNPNNNSMIGRNNISCLEVNNINNLNSSFDSLMRNYGNNNSNLLYGVNLNNSFYNNGNSNTNIYTGRINNSNFLNPDNISNLNLNNLNTNNSYIQPIRQPQLINYDQNNSFNIGYNNPLCPNILNNNFLGINNMNNNFQRNNYYSSINIEDLLILEEKLGEIMITLNKTKIVHNECFEFWNYYYNCSLYGLLEKLFTNIYESTNVQLSINYLLMSIMICYEFSFDMNILNNSYSVLDEILKLNHQNLIIIFEHILTKVSSDSRDNIWVFKLHDIVNKSKNSIYNNNDYLSINEYTMSPVEKITYNTGIVIQNIRVLLKNNKSSKIEQLTSFFKKLNEKSYEDINVFFRECILRVDNMNGSVLASIFLKENHIFKTEPAPYLKTKNRKPYSLILDLDETLVHFKVNPQNDSEGVLRVRPGIVEFLDSIDQYYELIIFTAATQEYADLLIDAVEENKIYFEHRLYRQHTVIIDNDFVKDLSRVGRPLDKIAIVDNMPQNFRLQKENGINIKAFWGEEVYDTALIDLAPILINIAKEGGDIRVGLAKYRDEIVKKVTSNISKHTQS